MGLPDIRQRAGLLFLAVAVGHIVLISAQVNSHSGIPLLQTAVFGAFSQVQRAAAWVAGGARSTWRNYVDLRSAQSENAALRKQVAKLQLQLQQQASLVGEASRLRQLLDLREQAALQTLGAQVIGGGAAPDSRTVTIDRGTRDGLRMDMAVVARGGVVGRVITPSGGTSKVQLLVDRNAGVAGLVERSRAQGIVVGTGEELMHLEYVSATADIRAGDTIVTSGIDGIYPKGLVIGRVHRVERAGTAYKRISVRPAVDFGSLEEVLVVTAVPPPVASTPPVADAAATRPPAGERSR